MASNILIFGNGWIGNLFAERLHGSVVDPADIANRKAVGNALDYFKPRVVINCAGEAGRPNIDWCEENPAPTYLSNTAGPLIVAQECLDRNIHLTHLGTGCVYEGDNLRSGFSEADPPTFKGNVYSRSKALAEQALKDLPVLQLRLRMPFTNRPHPRNLITKLVKYGRTISIPNSITYLDEFLDTAVEMFERRMTGIWNLTNPGSVTHARILDLYQKWVDPKFSYKIMTPEELQGLVKCPRPHCVLQTKKAEKAGFRMGHVEAALETALMAYRRALDAGETA